MEITSPLRHAVFILSLALASIGIGTASSPATFPGSDGPIAFRQVDPRTGFGVPLFRAMPDGSQIRELSARPGFFSDWRHDGKRIAFDYLGRDGDEQIATMSPDGGNKRVITSGGGIHEAPSWSPDGRRIIFNYSPKLPGHPDFVTHLWTMRADGSRPRRLAMRSRGFDVEPRYSPDGRWIAFNRLRFPDGGFKQAAFVVATDGNHRVRRLTPWRLNSEHPTWSPDSRWIIFNNSPEGTIQVVRPNGKNRRTIMPAKPGLGGHKPSFSPAGMRILFMCENQGTLKRPPEDYNEDICVMNADGSDIVEIIDTPGSWENFPSWGPAP